MTTHITLITKPQKDYELIDCGDGEKLERYGNFLLARPDPQALWNKNKPKMWVGVDGVFIRNAQKASWKIKDGVPESWKINLADLFFVISPTAFKHTGVFPEQESNWRWLGEQIEQEQKLRNKKKATDASVVVAPVSVLNLFGYTGGATLASARAGAHVVHVDSSKSAISWARDNATASGLSDKPIRWILDDVRKFVAREIKRGSRYDGIILDPPSFGHGTKKELWKIEKDLQELLLMCKKILSDKPLFFLMNGYAAGYSATTYGNNISDIMKDYDGKMEIGELAIEESQTGRLLPCGIFARWSKF